jgi:hypothetical protein
MTRYELRTARGSPYMAFDDEKRAVAYRNERRTKHGIELALWRVRVVEERVG